MEVSKREHGRNAFCNSCWPRATLGNYSILTCSPARENLKTLRLAFVPGRSALRRLAEVEVEFGFEFEGTLPCASNGELRLSILVAHQPTRCDNIRQVLKFHRTYQIALVCR